MIKLPGKMLSEIWKSLCKKPATVMYPTDRLEVPEGFRGYIAFDRESCIGCGMCARDCPTGACTMRGEEGKKRPVFDMTKCMFCGQCALSCPKKSIILTKKFETATSDKDELVVE